VTRSLVGRRQITWAKHFIRMIALQRRTETERRQIPEVRCDAKTFATKGRLVHGLGEQDQSRICRLKIFVSTL